MGAPKRSLLVAGGMILLSATANTAETTCKPALAIAEAHISEVKDLQRTWSAIVVADVSSCATSSGQFQIEFTRLKENAPDIRFAEHFSWSREQTRVSLDIWWDEWLQGYRIAQIAPCPCRK